MTAILEGPPLTGSGASDAELIEASLLDSDLFSTLYDRHAGQLYRYAYRRVGPDVAEDVVADTFLAAFRHRDRYDPARLDARPWLFGIVTKEISRHHRKEKARYRAMNRVAGELPTDGLAERVADGVTAQAVRGELANALAKLSAGDRDVLLLVAWGGLEYAEVAEALRIPVGTVRSRLNRARRKVRAALGGSNPTTLGEDRS